MSKRIRIQESLGTFEVDELIETSSKGSVLEEGKKYVLKPKIKAIHSGLTKNKTFYPSERLQGDPQLKSGVYSWTDPYPKPMIKNHDTHSAEPLGRIHHAEFKKDPVTDKQYLIVTPTISDKDAIEKILDGRYATVSIGAETDAVYCSICGENLLENEYGAWGHEHTRGQKYDGEEAYWIVGNIWFKELSFVNVPADTNAMVIDVGEPIEVSESDDGEMVLNLDTGELVSTSSFIEGDPKTNTKEGEETRREDEQMKVDEKDQATEETEVKEDEVDETVEGEDAEDKEGSEDTSDTSEKEDVEESDDDLPNLTETVAYLSAENVKLKESNRALREENKELSEKASLVPELEEKIQKLESNLSETESGESDLIERVAALEAEIHKGLAEKVVDLKISLGKLSEDKRDEEVESHEARTSESLKDALKDLEEEKSLGLRLRPVGGTVTNPGASALEGESNVHTEGVEKKEEEKVTDYDVIKNLFTRGGR